VEACCEKELCKNGSPAPLDPDTCVFACCDGGLPVGCIEPCPTDGSESPDGCVKVCTGSPFDPLDCQELCCPELAHVTHAPVPAPSKPTSAPTIIQSKVPSSVPSSVPSTLPSEIKYSDYPSSLPSIDPTCSKPAGHK
jgi:hypothetical protein